MAGTTVQQHLSNARSKLQVNELSYNTTGVELAGKFGLVPVTIRLNRRALQRTRLISVNDQNILIVIKIISVNAAFFTA